MSKKTSKQLGVPSLKKLAEFILSVSEVMEQETMWLRTTIAPGDEYWYKVEAKIERLNEAGKPEFREEDYPEHIYPLEDEESPEWEHREGYELDPMPHTGVRMFMSGFEPVKILEATETTVVNNVLSSPERAYVQSVIDDIDRRIDSKKPVSDAESPEEKEPFVFFPVEQPDPVDGGRPVGESVRSLFVQILQSQEDKGMEKYGTALKAHNGRDALMDLLAELVDAFQYAVQALVERKPIMSVDCEIRGGRCEAYVHPLFWRTHMPKLSVSEARSR